MFEDIRLPKSGTTFKLDHAFSPQADLKINGSIVEFGGNYYCVYRTDNLFNYDAGNYLSVLNHHFQAISHIRLNAANGNVAFEDVRLFVFKGRLMAVYTYLPKIGKGKWKWSFGVGIAEVNPQNGLLTNQQSLRGLAKTEHEKNYAPFVYKDELYFMASIEPQLRVLKAVGEPGEFDFSEVYLSQHYQDEFWEYGNLRGGTPFLRSPSAGDPYLYSFVHSSIQLPNGNFSSRFYFYTIMRINPENYYWEIYNKPMCYSQDEPYDSNDPSSLLRSKNLSLRVVFPMGLIPYQNGVLMSYGKDDCMTRMKFYHWQYLQGLF